MLNTFRKLFSDRSFFMNNKNTVFLGLILISSVFIYSNEALSASSLKYKRDKETRKRAKQNLSLKIENVYSDISEARKRNVHPLQILRSVKYQHLFSAPVTPESVRNFLKLSQVWLKDLYTSPRLIDLDDYIYTMDYFNQMARGTLYPNQIKPKEADKIGLRNINTALNYLSISEIVNQLKFFESYSYHFTHIHFGLEFTKDRTGAADYLFSREMKRALAIRAYENPEVMNPIYADTSFAATLVKFSVLEYLAGKPGVEKKLRTKLLSSLTDGDFWNFDRILQHKSYAHRFFKIVSLMKKDYRLLNRTLVRYIERYPERAKEFVLKLELEPNKKQIRGFAKVLFLSKDPKIKPIQFQFLKAMEFYPSVEENITSSLKKANKRVPKEIMPALVDYRRKASLGLRCMTAFRRLNHKVLGPKNK